MTEPTADEAALDVVATLIRDRQPGSMVQRFVLLVETIDDEDRWISAFCAPGQKPWDTLGLLQYGLAYETSAFVAVEEE